MLRGRSCAPVGRKIPTNGGESQRSAWVVLLSRMGKARGRGLDVRVRVVGGGPPGAGLARAGEGIEDGLLVGGHRLGQLPPQSPERTGEVGEGRGDAGRGQVRGGGVDLAELAQGVDRCARPHRYPKGPPDHDFFLFPNSPRTAREKEAILIRGAPTAAATREVIADTFWVVSAAAVVMRSTFSSWPLAEVTVWAASSMIGMVWSVTSLRVWVA